MHDCVRDKLCSVYYALVESHLRYGDAIWGSLCTAKLAALQRLQSRAWSIIENTKLKDLWSQNKNKGRRETLLFRQRDTLRTKEIMETRLSKLNSLPQYGRLLRYLLLTGISEKILRKSKRKSHFRMYRHTFHIK